ncbi:MAG: GGDEF domain-containing protein [Lachnospiraceae bacterium]|nr:GGDEF domain-containing protein [Lachnospiraceae bacterium]
MERVVEEKSRIVGVVSHEFTISDGNQQMQEFFTNRRAYPITQLMHEEDRPAFLSALEKKADEGFDMVMRVLCLDNVYRWHYIFFQRFYAETGRMFYRLEMQDICQIEAYVKALERQNGQYERLLGIQHNMFFMYFYDTKKIRIFWMNNNIVHTIVEKDLDVWEVEGCSKEQFSVEDELAFHMMCKDIRNGTERFVHDVVSKELSKDGKERLYRFRGVAWRYKGELKECYGTIQLVDKRTNRIKLDSTLEEQLDPLTGLYNKRTCMEKIRGLIEENADTTFTICMIDLDNFKSMNDTYGHLFGDRVLMVVADTMREVLGNRGIAGRFGGDEFFIVIDSALDEQEVRQILFTIRKNIRWFFENSEDQILVTLSVGAAAYPKDGQTIDQLMAMADRALYIAKEKGKDRYIIYDEEKHGRVTFDEEHRKIVEMSMKKQDDTNKTSAILYAYEMLEQKGIDALEDVLAFVGKVFAIDRINIFRGLDLRLWKAWGAETWTQDNAGYILLDNYLGKFNAHKVYCRADIESLAYKYPKVHQHLNKLEIKSSVQYLVGEGSNMTGVISYEVIKFKRKWSDEDEHNLTIISRFIENAILKAEKENE